VTPAKDAQRTYKRVGENLYRNTPSANYYALLKRGGKQFRRSLKTSDRALAARRLADLRRQIGALTLSDAKNSTFADVAKVWLSGVRHALKPATIQRRMICIKGLKPFFKGVSIRNVTRQHCDNWLNKRAKNLSPSSFAQELDTLRLVLDHAVNRGLLLSNPAQSIKRRRLVQAEITVPSRDQFQKLIAALRDDDGTFGTQGNDSFAKTWLNARRGTDRSRSWPLGRWACPRNSGGRHYVFPTRV